MKRVKHFGFLSLLLLILFWGIGNAVYALPQASIPLNSQAGNQIKLKKLLNKEGVLFNFQQQEFETVIQLSVLDKLNTEYWLVSKRTATTVCNLSGFELQYIIYSNTIEPGLDSLTMIFPFHSYI
ncbi:hypothetical protein ABXZ32_09360 [Sediminicola luteus]|uniref:Uncharacterized protein n=1 Tax=Sediminicola luteus TaxID=319238 RepID=A0ABV2TWF5_9FLAO